MRQTTTNTIAPIGRLKKKTHGQPTVSVRRPPIAGPIRTDRPNTAPNSPWYLPRSDGEKRSPITASAIGNSAPAPRPWIPRARDSCHISCDKPGADRPDHEDADPEQEDRPPPEQVGELAVQRAADRRGQQVGGEGPRVELVPAEIRDDPSAAPSRPRSGRARRGRCRSSPRRGSASGRDAAARWARRSANCGPLVGRLGHDYLLVSYTVDRTSELGRISFLIGLLTFVSDGSVGSTPAPALAAADARAIGPASSSPNASR